MHFSQCCSLISILLLILRCMCLHIGTSQHGSRAQPATMPNIRHRRAKKWRIILSGPPPVVKKALKAIDERKNSSKRNRGLASIRSLGDDAHAVEWHGDPPSYNAVYSWFALALEKVEVEWRLDADDDGKQDLAGTAGPSGAATGSASTSNAAPVSDTRRDEPAAVVAATPW